MVVEEIAEGVKNLTVTGDAAASGGEGQRRGGGGSSNRIQVSNTKKPLFFYVNLAKRYMQQHEDVELSALGMGLFILVKLVIGDLVLNVISAYAPQVGLNENSKREFWEGLEDMVSSVPVGEKLFIGGDLNGHVGTSSTSFEGVHGGFDFGTRNQEGEEILNFALAYDMFIANTFFRKRTSHLVTFSSGQHTSQIDFVLLRKEDRHACLDCKVIPGECVVTQHKLVVADFRFKIRLQRNKHNKVTRTKWWKLKGDVAQTFKERVIEEGPWAEEGDSNIMWRKMAMCIRKIASEEFGLSQGNRREVKDTWWWNEDVQKAIKEKKDCYKRLHHDKCAENIEKYRIAKKSAKRAVSRARGQAFDNLYQRLDTKQGEKDIYRMAKIRERKTRDVNQVKCIKNEANQLLVKNEEIKNRWKEYFNKLFNGGNESSTIELDEPFDDNNRGFVRRIQEYEVKEALKRMKVGKAMGPDAIATVVTVAEILKNNGFAVEKKIRTSTVEINDESRGRPFQKAKIEIILGKSDKFDELMAAAAEERGEVEDGEEQA
ncbi:Retrovirus-related Pol polyprotein LINE-1 [Zea mays]|uniref:Retrovirus-related Pol polyprotein LINE-1 n=1 Tax=Zea mays TaxID=4577 RepID=A0A1D6MK45_MAIZE|nr:Retrovirus-related Pol polyprotein LINE-1 [Zea mays]